MEVPVYMIKARLEPLDNRKTILSIKEEGLGMNEKADFITIKGTITFIKHDNDPWYCACPTEGCNKKVFETTDNRWACEKCSTSFDKVLYNVIYNSMVMYYIYIYI